MAQSMNTKVDLSIKATSFHSLSVYGDMLVGDKAIEFYNEKNVEDYVQIPWTEVDHVVAEVIFGKIIPRFAIVTKENGNFAFSTRDNKKTLRAIREYVPADRMVRSAGFFKVVGLGLKRLGRIVTGREKL